MDLYRLIAELELELKGIADPEELEQIASELDELLELLREQQGEP